MLYLFKYIVVHCFSLKSYELSDLLRCPWPSQPKPNGLLRRSVLGEPHTPRQGPGRGLASSQGSFRSPCVCIFMKECVVCQLHCHLSLDNLLTSRILECQPGCLYNCCLCQSLCEKCHRENEVRKQSCSLFFTKVTTTESITCFQDSFENISSSWKKRRL